MVFRSANTYTNTMTSVIRNVYRKLEEFLIKEGKKSIEAISADDFQVIRSPLIQAREWLYEPELETLFKFVKFTYNLNGDKDLNVERAVRLYGQIMLTLEKQNNIEKIKLGLNKRYVRRIRKGTLNCQTLRMFADNAK